MDCKHKLVISKWYGTNTTLTANEFLCEKCWQFLSREDVNRLCNVVEETSINNDDIKDPWFHF